MGPENVKDKDLCSEHSGIVQMYVGMKETITGFSDNIKTLFTKFDNLSDKFEEKIVEFAQRPTWLVCTVISCMSGIIGVLTTFILYAHFAGK